MIIKMIAKTIVLMMMPMYNLIDPNDFTKWEEYKSNYDEGLLAQGKPMLCHCCKGKADAWLPFKPFQFSCKQDAHVHFPNGNVPKLIIAMILIMLLH